MTNSEPAKIQMERSKESARSFWLCFAFLLAAVFLFHGKPVPFSNEFVYLLRLDPYFLPNDWTFSQSANEHWLFNFIFGFPARIISLETIGWLGRIAVWVLCLHAIIKLGKIWEISYSAIALGVCVWLASAQAVVNDEWIFGGFEAKTAAYACLLGALLGFSKRRIIASAVLLGLSFSFHPAVGLWAIPAVGLALLFEKIPTIDFVKVVFVTGICSLFGLIALFGEQTNAAANSFENWRFIVLYRVPWHLDLFSFSKLGIILLFAMLIFNRFALRQNKSFALNFLLNFQLALAAFFLFGLLLRWLELYPLLRLMPMRLFPVLTPLFFMFTVFRAVPRFADPRQKTAAALIAFLMIVLLSPFGKGVAQIRETVRANSSEPDDLQQTARWIAKNTQPDAQIIQPPHRRDLWYFSRRAQIVSYGYPTFNRLDQWRERIADLTANHQIVNGETAAEEIEKAYNQLSAEQIAAVKLKYAAQFLVSRASYPFEVLFETATYKIYRLP